MPSPALRFPDAVRDWVARRYRRQHQAWLAGEGTWPLHVALGCPSEEQAQSLGADVAEWVEAWRRWQGPGSIAWCERRWRTLGAQRLPEHLVLASAAEAASMAGEETRWAAASENYRRFSGRWPAFAPRLPRWYDALAALDPVEAARLEALVAWLDAHPRSGLLPRQLPIPGMDTKWIERRLPIAADLLAAGESCGLRRPPVAVRFRILDPSLRQQVGGLGDICAPIDDVRALSLRPRSVCIVENVQTGLAFEDLPGTVVVMGLGYGVSCLADVPWVAGASCTYWGDIDTHGFAILDRARAALPRVASILMDEATLLRYPDLWVREPEQCTAEDLPLLSDAERAVYRSLKQQRWGSNVRLEQERIPWDPKMVTDTIFRYLG